MEDTSVHTVKAESSHQYTSVYQYRSYIRLCGLVFNVKSIFFCGHGEEKCESSQVIEQSGRDY